MEAIFVSLIFLFLPLKEIEIKGLTKGLERKSERIIKNFIGKEANKENLDSLTSSLVRFFLNEGYPYARIRYTGFIKERNGLKVIISVKNLKPVLIYDIYIGKEVKTNKNIFYRYFPFKGKVFSLEKLKEGKKRIENFPLIKIEGFSFKKINGKDFLFLDVKEKKSSYIEIFAGYDRKKKGLYGKIDINLFNFFRNLRTFKVKWYRISDKKTDFEILYTEPFLGPFEFSTSIFYNLFQRDSFYTTENIGIRGTYRFEKGNLSLSYSYNEETPFLKNKKFYTESTSEILFGRKELERRNNFYFSVSGGVIKSDNVSFKGLINIFYVRNIFRNWYFSSDIYYGEINLKDTLLSEFFFLGGTKLPRGYSEEEFETRKYFLFSFENHFVFSNFSIFLFLDHLIFYNVLNKTLFKTGYGFGFKGFSENLEFKISYGFPYKESLNYGKIHFVIKNYF